MYELGFFYHGKTLTKSNLDWNSSFHPTLLGEKSVAEQGMTGRQESEETRGRAEKQNMWDWSLVLAFSPHLALFLFLSCQYFLFKIIFYFTENIFHIIDYDYHFPSPSCPISFLNFWDYNTMASIFLQLILPHPHKY